MQDTDLRKKVGQVRKTFSNCMDDRLTSDQLFAVGFHGHTLSPEIKTLIHDYGVGGIVLFKRNVRDAQQLQVRGRTPLPTGIDRVADFDLRI